jgi:hypothetical protein
VEQPLLRAAPTVAYEVPEISEPKVHRDHHVEVARAIYSVPGNRVGRHIYARATAKTVKLFDKGELIKVHPRQAPGGRSTDRADLPSELTAYALRDVNYLVSTGKHHGEAIGAYLAELLGGPLPWTRMRQAYRLLGLVRKWGAERTEAACARALEAQAVDVNLVARMLERAKEADQSDNAAGDEVPKNVTPGRFSRPASDFAANGGTQ